MSQLPPVMPMTPAAHHGGARCWIKAKVGLSCNTHISMWGAVVLGASLGWKASSVYLLPPLRSVI